MPAYTLFQDLGKACHAATFSFWRWRRQVPHERNLVSGTLNQPRGPRRRSPVLPSQKAELSGADFLAVFEDIVSCTNAASESESLLQACNAEIRAMQRSEDLTSAALDRCSPTMQEELSNFHSMLDTSLEYAARRKSKLLTTRAKLLRDLNEQKEGYTSAWSKLGQDAALYFQQCLAAEFREPWSLPDAACRDLRKLLDLLELNESAKARLRTLRYKMITIRNAQWRTERAIQTVPQILPDPLGQRLDTIRTASFNTEIENAQTEFDALEMEVADRSEVTEAELRKWSMGALSNFLETARRRGSQGKPASDEIMEQAGLDEEAEQSYGSGSSSSDLLEEFIAERDFLEEEQRRAGICQAREQDEATQAERIMLFGRSSLPFFAAREEARLKFTLEHARGNEQRFEDARDRLLASGKQIPPRTPPRVQKKPRGGLRSDAESGSSDRGARVSRDSIRIKQLNRRPVNTWRFQTQGAASESRVTRRSSFKLSDLDSDKARSGSFSISPWRAKKRDEYKEAQEGIRVGVEQEREQ